MTASTPVETMHFSNKETPQTGVWLRLAGYAPKGIMQMTLRQFLFDNFGWDIYEWGDEDIRF